MSIVAGRCSLRPDMKAAVAEEAAGCCQEAAASFVRVRSAPITGDEDR